MIWWKHTQLWIASCGSKSNWALVHMCACKVATNTSHVYVSGKNNRILPIPETMQGISTSAESKEERRKKNNRSTWSVFLFKDHNLWRFYLYFEVIFLVILNDITFNFKWFNWYFGLIFTLNFFSHPSRRQRPDQVRPDPRHGSQILGPQTQPKSALQDPLTKYHPSRHRSGTIPGKAKFFMWSVTCSFLK